MRNVKNIAAILCISIAGALLASCGGGSGGPQSAVPSVHQAPLGSNKLQLAVGTANIGQDGAAGLNVVATLRQPSGLSGVLADTPSLTGPFTVPAGAAGAYGPGNVDAGSNKITGSPQVNLNATPVNSTLGTFTGVFSYGFGPFNSDQSGAAYYPGNPNAAGGNGFASSAYEATSMVGAVAGADPTQPQPFFSADPMVYVVGPPAVPFFNDGTFPAGLAGYSPGFTVFELTPGTGTYTLSVNAAAVNASSASYSATATLNSAATLGPIAVTFVSDGAGGGSGTVTYPAGVSEAQVFVADAGTGAYFTISLTGLGTAGGSATYTLPDTLGACVGKDCQTGASAKPSLNSGDPYFAAAVGYDYPAIEAAPPGNANQTPAIAGPNGQADLTMSPIVSGTY